MMVYWLPEVTPDPMGPAYASVTDWPAASVSPPPLVKLPPKNPEKLPPGNPLEKFPEMVREKLPEKVLEKFPENVREKAVELKVRVKLNCPSGTDFRVLLLCTVNTAACAMQAGRANPGRVWFDREVVLVLLVVLVVGGPKNEHPLPGVTSSELRDTGDEPVFWIVTRRVLFERAALLITTLSCVVELVVTTVVEVVDARLCVVLELRLAGMRYMYPNTPAPTSTTTTMPTMATVATPPLAIGAERPARDKRRVEQASISRTRAQGKRWALCWSHAGLTVEVPLTFSTRKTCWAMASSSVSWETITTCLELSSTRISLIL